MTITCVGCCGPWGKDYRAIDSILVRICFSYRRSAVILAMIQELRGRESDDNRLLPAMTGRYIIGREAPGAYDVRENSPISQGIIGNLWGSYNQFILFNNMSVSRINNKK